MKIISFLYEKFSAFVKWLLKDWRNLLMIALAIAVVVLFFKYKRMKSEYDNINIITNDSITTYKNKIGELYAERSTYITDIKTLKKTNSELAQEVKNLKDNPIVVTKIKTETKIEKILVHDTLSVDSNGVYSFPVKYNDQWCNISGKSSFSTETMIGTAELDSISFDNNITVDLIEKDKQLAFIAKSDNPYCKINNIDGTVLSPEKSKAISKRFEKKWVVVAGIGPTVTVYESKVKVFPGIQVTIGRKLFAF